MDGETKKYQIEPSPTLGWAGACGFQQPVRRDVETVEKDSRQAILEDSEKSALLAGSTIDDLLVPRSEATRENWHRVAKISFSTVSLALRKTA
jgi:hypothetical protein